MLMTMSVTFVFRLMCIKLCRLYHFLWMMLTVYVDIVVGCWSAVSCFCLWQWGCIASCPYTNFHHVQLVERKTSRLNLFLEQAMDVLSDVYFLCCIASVARSNAEWCLWCQTSGGVVPEEQKHTGRHAFPWFAFSHAGAPLLWPGGASVATFAAELLAGPMWGGREGGPGCPSGQPGKRPRRSRLRRNAISRETACWTTQHATAFFLCNSLDGLPGGALGPPAGSAGSLRWERKCVWHTSNSHSGSWGSVHHPCHLSALRVSSQRLWLGGPARDPGFPVLALRQGLIQ